MTAMGDRVADVATRLVGTPFKLHGRDPRYGLDCVGLVHCSLEGAGLQAHAPQGYGLRNVSIDRFLYAASHSGLVDHAGSIKAGDIVLVVPGPAQHHLLIAGFAGDFIHANASLRRIVRMPGPISHRIARQWRPSNFEEGTDD